MGVCLPLRRLPTVAGNLGCFAVVLGLLAMSGCSTFSTHLTADPLEPGQLDLGLAVDMVAMFDTPQQGGGTLPVPALRARVGVLRFMDLGVLAQPTALEVSPRIRLIRGSTRLAIAPGVGFGRTEEGSYVSEARYLHLYMPVILTRDLAADRRLSFGPRVTHSRFVPRAGGQASGTLLGGFAAVEIPTSSGVWFSPELGIHRTVHGDVPVDGWVIHFGVGLGWRSSWHDRGEAPEP